MASATVLLLLAPILGVALPVASFFVDVLINFVSYTLYISL